MARHLVMKFSVWDDDKLSSDDFMGVAYMPIGAGMDGTHKLQLMPRPGNASDKKLLRKHGSLGSLIVEVKSNLAEDYPPMHSSDYQVFCCKKNVGRRGNLPLQQRLFN